MKWNEESLSAFSLYRWILRKQDSERIDLTTLKGVYPELIDKAQQNDKSLEENLLTLKDNIWLVFKLHNVDFFVITQKDEKRYIVKAVDLVDFLTTNTKLSPVWWPSHFATPQLCDQWTDEKIEELEAIDQN